MTESTRPDDDAAAQDIALMLAVKAGDERAFESLVERHQFRIVGTIAKMLGGESDAEDLAQQVFIRVWQSAPRYHPSAKFTTWLLTITRNLVFNEMRRRQRARLVPLDPGDADRPPVEHADSSVRSAPEEIAEAEIQEAVSRAIASLPETQRSGDSKTCPTRKSPKSSKRQSPPSKACSSAPATIFAIV